MSMLSWWREWLILALCVVIFGGYKMWPKPVVAPPESKTLTEIKQVIKTVTTHPDGRIEDKTITTEKETKVLSKGPDKSKYGVGAYINTADRNDYRIDASARLGGLPLFGVVGYEFKDKTIYAGIRAEF